MIIEGTSLLVLAGGESSRMGYPKHLLPAAGGTLMDQIIDKLGSIFSEVLVAGRGLEPNRSDARFIEDLNLIRSPLVGILSGMKESKNPYLFVIGCDMPFISLDLIRHLTSRINSVSDIVIPVVNGYYEPLCAIYSNSIVDRISQYLDSGGRKVTGFFESVKVTEIPESSIRFCDPLLKSFINLNTPNEYRNYNLS